jgi:hypothetical protein
VSADETPLEIAARGAQIGCDVEPVAVAFMTDLYAPPATGVGAGDDAGDRAWRSLDRARRATARSSRRRRLALWFSPRTLLPARRRPHGRTDVAKRDWRARSDVPFTDEATSPVGAGRRL